MNEFSSVKWKQKFVFCMPSRNAMQIKGLLVHSVTTGHCANRSLTGNSTVQTTLVTKTGRYREFP